MADLSETLLPPEVLVEVLRDYGQTANEKVNNLSSSLGFAIVTVVVFMVAMATITTAFLLLVMVVGVKTP